MQSIVSLKEFAEKTKLPSEVLLYLLINNKLNLTIKDKKIFIDLENINIEALIKEAIAVIKDNDKINDEIKEAIAEQCAIFFNNLLEDAIQEVLDEKSEK